MYVLLCSYVKLHLLPPYPPKPRRPMAYSNNRFAYNVGPPQTVWSTIHSPSSALAQQGMSTISTYKVITPCQRGCDYENGGGSMGMDMNTSRHVYESLPPWYESLDVNTPWYLVADGENRSKPRKQI